MMPPKWRPSPVYLLTPVLPSGEAQKNKIKITPRGLLPTYSSDEAVHVAFLLRASTMLRQATLFVALWLALSGVGVIAKKKEVDPTECEGTRAPVVKALLYTVRSLTKAVRT